MANGKNTIFVCCRRNDVEGLKTLFIHLDTNINIKDDGGDTPLHHAAYYNSKECLELLLEAGAEINARDKYGKTPLHHAAYWISKECLELLLEAGADPHIKNNKGNTPLDCICDENFKKEMEAYIQELSTFNIKEPSC